MPFAAKIGRLWGACRLEVKPAEEIVRLLLSKASVAKRLARFEMVLAAGSV